MFIASRKVTLYSDHQPLLGILGFTKAVPQALSPCMARWYVQLSAYDYDLKYPPGNTHQNGDAFRLLSLPEKIKEPSPPGDAVLFHAFPRLPQTASTIADMTNRAWCPHGCTLLWKTVQPSLSAVIRTSRRTLSVPLRGVFHMATSLGETVIVPVAPCAQTTT